MLESRKAKTDRPIQLKDLFFVELDMTISPPPIRKERTRLRMGGGDA